jgi:signal peptidase I
MMNEEQHIPDNYPNLTSNRKSKKESTKAIFGTVGMFLLAPVIALILVAFVFQSYRVDGQSMETTLSNNDRLIVTKIAKTWSKITHHSYIPARYDIVVFKKSETFGLRKLNDIQLIKRVIGLPGDRVVVKDGSVTIYNKENPGGFNPDKNQDYTSGISTTSGNVDVVVGKDQIFVMGDNRSNSLDSRVFGSIDSSSLVGTLAFRIYPL